MKKIFLLITLFFPLRVHAADVQQFQLAAPVAAPNISFIDDRNVTYNLSDYKGKVVVLNFWATWCEPCISEIPTIEGLIKAVEGKDIAVLPVSIDYKGAEVVKEFYSEKKITSMPVYIDTKGKAFREFKLQALPSTLVINKKGMVVAKVMGEIDWNSERTKQYLLDLNREGF